MLGISKNAMDTLLVNLKVLSKIECGDRIMTNKKCLELDKSKGWISTFLRWFREESRDKTIKEIHYHSRKNGRDQQFGSTQAGKLGKTRK